MAMGAEAASLGVTRRVYHFGAGPAILPPEVIAEIRDELPDFDGTGISILELGHRTSEFQALMCGIESDLRGLMGIPPHYALLFLQGGAALQFAMAPLNLGRHGAYLVTGLWSEKALREAQRLTQGQVVWDGRESGYTRVPACGEWQLPPDAPYLHYTA
ncbi:MAG: aminotransferase class V-fold PLP-dependent enzyme, partial [Rhodanobacteraceae bacterium]